MSTALELMCAQEDGCVDCLDSFHCVQITLVYIGNQGDMDDEWIAMKYCQYKDPSCRLTI